MTLTNKIKQLVAAGILGAASLYLPACSSPQQNSAAQTGVEYLATANSNSEKFTLPVTAQFEFEKQADIAKVVIAYNLAGDDSAATEKAIDTFNRIAKNGYISTQAIIDDYKQQNPFFGDSAAAVLNEITGTAPVIHDVSYEGNKISTRVTVLCTGNETRRLLEAILRQPTDGPLNTNKAYFDASRANNFARAYLQHRQIENSATAPLDKTGVLRLVRSYTSFPGTQEEFASQQLKIPLDFSFDTPNDALKFLTLAYASTLQSKKGQERSNYTSLNAIDLIRELAKFKSEITPGDVSAMYLTDLAKKMLPADKQDNEEELAKKLTFLYSKIAPATTRPQEVTIAENILRVNVPLEVAIQGIEEGLDETEYSQCDKFVLYCALLNKDGTFDQDRVRALLRGVSAVHPEAYTNQGITLQTKFDKILDYTFGRTAATDASPETPTDTNGGATTNTETTGGSETGTGDGNSNSE